VLVHFMRYGWTTNLAEQTAAKFPLCLASHQTMNVTKLQISLKFAI